MHRHAEAQGHRGTETLGQDRQKERDSDRDRDRDRHRDRGRGRDKHEGREKGQDPTAFGSTSPSNVDKAGQDPELLA